MRTPISRVEIDMPAQFEPSEADPLIAGLRKNHDASVEISGSGLRRIDTLLLQYLAAAARHWRERGLEFELVELPEWFEQEAARLGFKPDMLQGARAR